MAYSNIFKTSNLDKCSTECKDNIACASTHLSWRPAKLLLSSSLHYEADILKNLPNFSAIKTIAAIGDNESTAFWLWYVRMHSSGTFSVLLILNNLQNFHWWKTCWTVWYQSGRLLISNYAELLCTDVRCTRACMREITLLGLRPVARVMCTCGSVSNCVFNASRLWRLW